MTSGKLASTISFLDIQGRPHPEAEDTLVWNMFPTIMIVVQRLQSLSLALPTQTCFQRLWSLCNDCNRCSSPYLPNQPHPHKTNFNNLRWNSIQRQTVSTLPRDNLSSTAQYHFFPCSSIFDGYKDLSRSRSLRNIRISKFREGLEGSSLAAKAIWAKYYRIVQCYSNINY